MSSEFLGEQRVGDIAQNRGGKSRCVGIDNNKQRLVRQNAPAKRNKAPKALLKLPNLAAGTSPIGGRIHNDGVIAAAAADLPLDELAAVVHDPADGPVGHAGGGGVFLAPGDHALCRVHMADGSTRLCAGNRCSSRIGKEVQDIYRTLCPADLSHCEIPVARLLREYAGMLKVHRLYVEGKLTVAHLPAFRNIAFFPVSAACLTAAVFCRGLAPKPVFARRIPDRLRVGTY